MRAFRRDGAELVTVIEAHERMLLESLVEQYIELLGGQESGFPPGDPLAALAHELTAESTMDHSDPVIQRLFPDAYPDDPGANAEFQRYAQQGQRQERVAAATRVLADLDLPDVEDMFADPMTSEELRIPDAHADDWLRTLNGLRLTLAVRLGIEDDQAHEELAALPMDDPRLQLAMLYDWFGLVLESLLEVL